MTSLQNPLWTKFCISQHERTMYWEAGHCFVVCKSACLAGLTPSLCTQSGEIHWSGGVYEGNAASLGCVAGKWAAAFTALQLTADIYTTTSSNSRRGHFLEVSCNVRSETISNALLSHTKIHRSNWYTVLSFNYACAVISLSVNLTQYRTTWKENLSERLSRPACPMGMSLKDCPDYMSWCAKTQRAHFPFSLLLTVDEMWAQLQVPALPSLK